VELACVLTETGSADEPLKARKTKEREREEMKAKTQQEGRGESCWLPQSM